MSSCVAFLLSVEEFDYLAQLNVSHGLVGVRMKYSNTVILFNFRICIAN